MIRSSLINEVNSAVRDNLTGFVLRNANLQLLSDENIVLRKDFETAVLREGKVAVITGGGSGHEPGGSGFIGPGGLTGAIAGNMFASPSSGTVLKAIKLFSGSSSSSSSAGTFMIVPNYTGDRLNFGIAEEQAKLKGYKVESIVFGDDTAFKGQENDKVRARGIAGIILAYKIAGALADNGASLESIKEQMTELTKTIRTISVSLSGCNIPGSGPSFKLGSDELEIGVGIHGEAGTLRLKSSTVKEVVQKMLSYIVDNKSDGKNKPEKIVLLVNNLGGLSVFELNAATKEAVEQLSAKGFQIQRIYAGTLLTSFDMAGVSLTIMDTNEETLRLLDSPCNLDCPGFGKPGGSIPNLKDYIRKTPPSVTSETVNFESDKIPFGHELFLDSVRVACVKIKKKESYLNELDSEAGDADCGSTLAAGATEILKLIEQKELKPSFLQLATVVEKVMGGTSGAIYSLLFTGMSKVVIDHKINSFKSEDKIEFWKKALDNGMQLVSKYSLAKVGDRTFLDSLQALIVVLEESKGLNYVELAKMAEAKVKEAALKTATMKAKAGRASYVNASRLTKPDPGAMAVYIWVSAIATLFN